MEDGFSLERAVVGIFGVGLMGGSLALGLKGRCARIVGFDTHRPTIELALSKGIIDSAESDSATFLAGLDVLILAAPVTVIIDMLRSLPSLTKPCVVMDIGSTKREIVQAMSALPANYEPIGGHPICGRERLGLENADADLYKGAPFIFTPLERMTPYAKRITQEIMHAVGANYIEMTAEDHDRVFASTSHLPFLLSSALTLATPQNLAPFLGPGFRSTSRLAGTPSHMMMGILKSNRDNVLNAIESFRLSLDEIETALFNENYSELENILNQSQADYLTLVDR